MRNAGCVGVGWDSLGNGWVWGGNGAVRVGKVEGGGIVLRNVDGEVMKDSEKLEKPPEEVGESLFRGFWVLEPPGTRPGRNSSRKLSDGPAV